MVRAINKPAKELNSIDMGINKEKLEHVINRMQEMYQSKPGAQPILFDKIFKRNFINIICEHGLDGSRILSELKAKQLKVTKRQVDHYLRILFGSYKRSGRPSVYILDDNQRCKDEALYYKIK